MTKTGPGGCVVARRPLPAAPGRAASVGWRSPGKTKPSKGIRTPAPTSPPCRPPRRSSIEPGPTAPGAPSPNRGPPMPGQLDVTLLAGPPARSQPRSRSPPPEGSDPRRAGCDRLSRESASGPAISSQNNPSHDLHAGRSAPRPARAPVPPPAGHGASTGARREPWATEMRFRGRANRCDSGRIAEAAPSRR